MTYLIEIEGSQPQKEGAYMKKLSELFQHTYSASPEEVDRFLSFMGDREVEEKGYDGWNDGSPITEDHWFFSGENLEYHPLPVSGFRCLGYLTEVSQDGFCLVRGEVTTLIKVVKIMMHGRGESVGCGCYLFAVGRADHYLIRKGECFCEIIGWMH